MPVAEEVPLDALSSRCQVESRTVSIDDHRRIAEPIPYPGTYCRVPDIVSGGAVTGRWITIRNAWRGVFCAARV
jgi:hypothetical protein